MCSHVVFRGPHPGETAGPTAVREVKQPASQPGSPGIKQAGPRLTLECLLGESLPAASCLEASLLPPLPATAESRAWAGTCHKGSAGRQETHQWLEVTQALAWVHLTNLALKMALPLRQLVCPAHTAP